ncbi:MAG: uroporphyrinogen-III synthase [Methyloceanibacter sp.]
MTEELSGRRIVVPETRELGQLVRMLEARGADTVPCPMIAIRDAPDPAPVEAWLRRFAKGTCDDLVLMTGEGLRRLLGFARRFDLEPAFLAALAATRRITRGPKPVRALREVGLGADVPADEPTTEGVVAALERHNLHGHRVGVQLYPDNANERLLKFLKDAGAEPDAVLPYVYASEADDARVIAVISEMAAGGIDAIAFTSAPQVRRFRDVARASGREAELLQGFERIAVAAVGPIVAAELEALGVQVNIMPLDDTFFKKPLVLELAAALMKDK